MKAAVLHTSGQPPRFEEFPEPTPEQGEVVVQVKAAPLNNLSKMRASGSHYTSTPGCRLCVESMGLPCLRMGRGYTVADVALRMV